MPQRSPQAVGGPDQAGAEDAPDQVQGIAKTDSPKHDRSAAACAPQAMDSDEQGSEQEEPAISGSGCRADRTKQKTPDQAAPAQKHELDNRCASDVGSSSKGSDAGSDAEQEQVSVPKDQRQKCGRKSESRAQHMRSPGKLRMGLRAVAGKAVLTKRLGKLGDRITGMPAGNVGRAGNNSAMAVIAEFLGPQGPTEGLPQTKGVPRGSFYGPGTIELLSKGSTAPAKSGTPEELGRSAAATRKRRAVAAAAPGDPQPEADPEQALTKLEILKKCLRMREDTVQQRLQHPAASVTGDDASAPVSNDMSPVRCLSPTVPIILHSSAQHFCGSMQHRWHQNLNVPG